MIMITIYKYGVLTHALDYFIILSFCQHTVKSIHNQTNLSLTMSLKIITLLDRLCIGLK
jgi:hypothetical protein